VNAPANRQDSHPTWSRASGIVFGVLLIAAGIVLLAVNTFGLVLPFDFGQVGWPIFVIGPGIVLLIAGLLTGNDAGIGLSVAGGIVTMVGVILAYQSATDHWSSWAYAWALLAPTAVGAAMVLWGVFHGRWGVIRQGLGGLGIGLVLFIVGFGFFEGVLNIGGERGLAPLGRQALPVALIIAGALLVLSRLIPRREPRRAYSGWGPSNWGPDRWGPDRWGSDSRAPSGPETYPAPPPPGPTAAPWEQPMQPPPPSPTAVETSTTTVNAPVSDREERP
jgi:hypothetical protein